jgi:hypothetical protein
MFTPPSAVMPGLIEDLPKRQEDMLFAYFVTSVSTARRMLLASTSM